MPFIFLFAGDTESLWKIEKLRSDSMKRHTLATGFSCAKVANPSTPLFDLIVDFYFNAITKLMCFVCSLLCDMSEFCLIDNILSGTYVAHNCNIFLFSTCLHSSICCLKSQVVVSFKEK